jgi:hypothetical protein
MPTYRTTGALVALFPNNSSGLIGNTVYQDQAVSMADTLAGYDGLRAQSGMVGDGVTHDWSAFASYLNSSQTAPVPPVVFNLTGAGPKTLTQTPTLFGAGPALPGVSPNGGATFDFMAPGSGSVTFTPTEGGIFRDIQIRNGRVWFDMSGVTVEVPIISFENVWANDISCLLRDGDISAGLTRKIDKLIFRNNYLLSNDRGLFLNGNGSSRAWVTGNHVDDCARFGILVAPATPDPQNNGFADFIFYTNNLVENLHFSGSNSNPIYAAGRYASIMGNIAANSVFSGDANQHDFESFYFKLGVAAIIGNIAVDAGSGQGMFAMKGIGRTNSDNSPGGWDYVLVGNVGVRTASDQYNQPGIWVQCTDANIGCNVIDGATSYGLQVNKNAGDVSQRSTNLMIHDNHFINLGNSGVLVEGAHTNVWANRQMITGVKGTGQQYGIRFSTQSLGAAINYRMQGNTLWDFGTTAGARCDCLHVSTTAGTDSFQGSLPITDNVIDVSTSPDISNTYGLTFEGTGDIQGCVVRGNFWIGFTDPTKVIRNITAGGNRSGKVLTILDNVGFANDVRGTGSITVGTATVTINHLMPQTPNIDPTPAPTDITIQATGFLFGATQARVTNITATTFDVVTDSNVTGSDFTFQWRCRKTKWVFS